MTAEPSNKPNDKSGAARWIRSAAVALLAIGFCVPAAGFVVNSLDGLSGVSETEKRSLAAFPDWSGSPRTYTSDIDSFLEDNFGFRMTMIRAARKIRDNLGEDPSGVVYGQEGWLFLGDLDYRNEFEGVGDWRDERIDDWIDSLADTHETLSDRGIPFAAMIGPDKARIYPEFVPQDWREGTRRFRTRLHARAADSPRPTGLVDVEPELRAAKADGLPVYWQRDTHWTSIGTYGVAMRVMDALDPAQSLPRFQPGPAEMRTDPRLFDLDALAGFETSQEPPSLTIRMPVPGPGGFQRLGPQRADGADTDNFGTIRIGGLNPQGGRLVIVGDSFADAMIQHFYPSYAEIVRLHHGARFYDVSLDEVLAYEPDAVLFIAVERQAAQMARPFADADPS